VTTERAAARPRGSRIAHAAALIAVLTLVSRVAGFARTLVLGETVGYTHLADMYQTANTIPNIVFEIVAGGALAALVVPLLTGDLDRDDRAAVGATASALLSWVLVVLVPVALLVVVLADPVMALLAPGRSADQQAVGAGMLRIFAPQLPLYGVGIVLTGVLQAHRRFAWPVLAPLLSSLTVIGAYLTYGAVEPHQPDIPAVGRTVGVVVLSLCLVPAVRRLGLPWRPTLRLADGQRRAVRELVWVGVLTVAAQQLTTALTIALVNWRTGGGALIQFNQAQTVYLLPWAVLAVPVATSAYPALASASAAGDLDRFRRTLAGATRGVLLLSGLGAAALAALAWPFAWTYARVAHSPGQASGLAAGIAAFAPGLLGYGLFALHSRALYAHRRPGHRARLGCGGGAGHDPRADPAGERAGGRRRRGELGRHAGARCGNARVRRAPVRYRCPGGGGPGRRGRAARRYPGNAGRDRRPGGASGRHRLDSGRRHGPVVRHCGRGGVRRCRPPGGPPRRGRPAGSAERR